MVKYLSGRQKLRPSDKLTEDRYQYLGLDQAEPNLADPATSPGVPSGLQYQLVAVTGYEGRRYWVPVGGSLQPGAITIFDEGTPVSSASSITQLNFVGAAVTANVSLQNPSGHPGIAATVTVIPVNVGDSPPNYPTPNEGELWWESDTGDLYVYYNDGSSAQWVMANAGGRGITGDKGEAGDKGQKGDTGLTGGAGQKGDKGEKGAPSTVAGPAGDKGQKGEVGVGDKGQKGEEGVDGSDGDKGQKGELGTKGDKGDGSAGGASVTISDNAPSSPNNGDLWWESDTFDLHVYYQDGSSNQWVSITSNAALKGEKGDKGQKGEVGDKGQKGEVGVEGQKGEIGSTGGTGGTGAKGQKGEVGTGGSDGSDGDKGQKGEAGAAASKGQKGEKGQLGADGGSGADGSDGAKGQKGEVGAGGATGIPSGFIGMWSGSAGSIPSGWYLCDGNNSTPDLRNKFVIGASNSTGDTTYPGLSPDAQGGSADATLVSHSHTINNHTHSVSGTTGNDTHNHSIQSSTSIGGGSRVASQNDTGNTATTTNDTHSHSFSATTGNPSNRGTNSQGSSATNANLPPYYALCYIMKS